MTEFSLDGLDLAALLCSKVCHDLINPVSALVNALEVLDGDKDAEMQNLAFDLVKKSATVASAKLKFCRLAYGAAGSAGATIDLAEAEIVARGFIEDERTKLDWNSARALWPKNKVKLILNLCAVGAASIPRGGQITMLADAEGQRIELAVEGRTTNPTIQHKEFLLGAGDPSLVDTRAIQAHYTRLLAKAAGMRLDVVPQPDGRIRLEALTVAAPALAAPAA
jgi:histidine phosphotransferase ChpT